MNNNKLVLAWLSVASLTSGAAAFAPLSFQAATTTRQSTELALGIPKFLLPDDNAKEASGAKAEKNKTEEKKVGLSGLFQLITAGAGAPFLGDFQGVDEETGRFMFELEANNLVRSNSRLWCS